MDRTALITGASRGIGKAICDKFVAEGYNVLSPGRTELDLASFASISAFIKKNAGEPIDVIVNNAGINKPSAIEAATREDFEETLQINVKAPFQLVQGFASGMKKRRYGRIVNIGSIWGVISKAGRVTYATSKSALLGMTRSMAIELAPYGILVNAVCPGFVDTDMTRKNLGAQGIKDVEKAIPLGRLALPMELAETVYFIASETNTYLTGQAIIVDGGYSIQ